MIVYINVIAKMLADGEVVPLRIEWEDGSFFDIDKVLDIKRRASTKGGGMGLRYKVRILGQERFLFLAEYKWFVEKEEKDI